MQQQPARPAWRLIDWIIVPYYRPEYRRLLLWSFTLSTRLHLLSLVVTIIGPMATPGLVTLLRQWFENLQVEVAEFKRTVRAPRSRLVMARETAATRREPAAATEYENPWA